MSRSGVEMDEHGNLVHERSGEILKIWVEDNAFTGKGHHIDIKKEEKEKKVRCKYLGKTLHWGLGDVEGCKHPESNSGVCDIDKYGMGPYCPKKKTEVPNFSQQ